jgi:protein SCO1
MKSKKTYFILLLVLFLPLLAIIILQQGEAVYKGLEIYGPKQTDEAGDTVYHSIPDFELTNQFAEGFAMSELDDNIIIAGFIFTRCPVECPIMTSNMRLLQDHFRDLPVFHLLSFTVNPEYDSPDVLLEYANTYDVNHDKWTFLTGDKEKIYRLARESFFVTAMEGDGGPDDFIHSETLILLDPDHRIRGLYDGMNQHELKSIKEDVLSLLNEYGYNAAN